MPLQDSILAGLASGPGLLKSFVDAIPHDACHLRRRDGYWTIAEHIDHLAHVQPILADRVEAFAQEAHPTFAPYIPDADAEQWPPDHIDVADAWRRFDASRRGLLTRVAELDPSTWRQQADHPEYSQYGFEILMRHILHHDHWHMYRIEELWLTREDYLDG